MNQQTAIRLGPLVATTFGGGSKASAVRLRQALADKPGTNLAFFKIRPFRHSLIFFTH
jgi:hypothetical protein